METEEGEEMEMAADVVINLIRDKSEETKSVSPYSTRESFFSAASWSHTLKDRFSTFF